MVVVVNREAGHHEARLLRRGLDRARVAGAGHDLRPALGLEVPTVQPRDAAHAMAARREQGRRRIARRLLVER